MCLHVLDVDENEGEKKVEEEVDVEEKKTNEEKEEKEEVGEPDEEGGSRIKAGDCPAIDPTLAGICVSQCGVDADCVGTQKCCSNGCGLICVDPSQPGIIILDSSHCHMHCYHGYCNAPYIEIPW